MPGYFAVKLQEALFGTPDPRDAQQQHMPRLSAAGADADAGLSLAATNGATKRLRLVIIPQRRVSVKRSITGRGREASCYYNTL